MQPLSLIEKFIDWVAKTFYYNCKKGRHQWGYKLSELGGVYLNDEDVPKELWHCRECKQKKYFNPNL
jgi:hypothetical protein